LEASVGLAIEVVVQVVALEVLAADSAEALEAAECQGAGDLYEILLNSPTKFLILKTY
jgi:hypothetical protein